MSSRPEERTSASATHMAIKVGEDADGRAHPSSARLQSIRRQAPCASAHITDEYQQSRDGPARDEPHDINNAPLSKLGLPSPGKIRLPPDFARRPLSGGSPADERQRVIGGGRVAAAPAVRYGCAGVKGDRRPALSWSSRPW